MVYMYLENKNVAVTGKFIGIDRNEIKSFLEEKGAVYKPSMSNKVDILIVGHVQTDLLKFDSRTKKMKMAADLIEEGKKIEFVFEEEFLSFFKEWKGRLNEVEKC